MKAFLLLTIALALVNGHGRSTKPVPRDVGAGKRIDEQNAPVRSSTSSDFVCRDLPKAGNTATITAGGSTTFQWAFSAAHVGDCAAYLSYDGGNNWFKIWEMFDCKSANNQDVQVAIPSYLPACGSCILRWEWYALHQWPNVEFYAQCADVQINGGGSTIPATFKIPGHLPPNNGVAPGYRNPFGGTDDRRITGPAIATVGSTPVPVPAPTPNTPPPPPPAGGGGSSGICYSDPSKANNLNGAIASTCGPNGAGNRCADGFCCSKYGYCGNTDEYCVGNLGDWRTTPCTLTSGKCYKSSSGLNLNGKVNANAACGQNSPGSRCPNENCCSTYGYCGTTDAHCNNNQGDWRTVACSGANNVAVRDNISYDNSTEPVEFGTGFSSASKVAAGLLAIVLVL